MKVAEPGVYLVSDSGLTGGRGVVETVRHAVHGGVTTVQVREKHADARDVFDLLVAVADAVGDRAMVLVNDRVDVFLAARESGADVDGVHIGQRDLSPDLVRRTIGPDAVIGLTANTPGHLKALGRLDPTTVDYLGVGAIRATSTKPDHPTPLGVDGFARFATGTDHPCVAIGGVTAADAGALRAAGAAGVAVVSAICAAQDAGQAATDLAKEWGS